MSIPTVLVLCTGNTYYSQMAEVILTRDLDGQVRAVSAGTRPHKLKVADGTIATLNLAGLPVATLHLPFHDPHGEPLESFIQTRDDIRSRLVSAVKLALKLG